MRPTAPHVLLALLSVTAACRATSPAPEPPADDAAADTAEESPPVWIWTDVEVMGQHGVEREAILAEAGFRAGEPYETDFEGWARTAEHIRDTFGFADVRISAVRYVGFEAYLTIDVVEAGDEHRLRYRPAPTGERPLADGEVMELFSRLGALRAQGFERGSPSPEVADEGFLDFADPALHEIALELREAVPPHRSGLIEVLAHDADREKRAQAATLLNWAGDVQDSIAQVHAYADDPDGTVRNNVTRFMLHYLALVDSSETRREVVRGLAVQLERPSHADRNKAAYGLLHIAEAWPQDLAFIDEQAGESLRYIARESILSNVRDPAQKLLDRIAAGGPTGG